MSRRHRRSKAMANSIVFLVALSLMTGCSLLPVEEEGLKPPLVKPVEESYRTVVAERGTIALDIRSVGALESVSTEHLQFTSQGGRVAQINAKAGDTVKKGDVLLQLDFENTDLQLKEREIALIRAKQALRSALQSEDEESIQIARLQMDIEQIKYQRLQETFANFQLIAGMDGKVTFAEDLKEGDVIKPYQTLFILSDPAKQRIALRTEGVANLNQVVVGAAAYVRLNRQDHIGTVVQTPASAPQTTDPQLLERYGRTMYIELDKLPPDVKLGMSADVRIVLQEREDVVLIPRSGLRSYLGRTFVRTLEQGNKIREVDVETGIQGTTHIEIVKGIEAGESIVLQ